MLKVLLKRLVSRLRGQKLYAMGNALAIGLRKGLVDAGVPVALRRRAHRTWSSRTAGWSASRVTRDGRAVDPRPPRRGPRQRRLREQPRAAAEAPAAPDLGRLDDRRAVQHRRRDPGGHRGRRGHRAHGRRLVGSDDPAPERPVVLPGRAQPARLDHRQPRRPAVHERGAPLRRGGARDLRRRGHRRRPRAVLDGHRPALPQPLPLRRARRRASPSRGAGTRTARSRRPPRSTGSPPRSASRPTRSRRPSTGSTASPRPASTRTSTAARAPTTSTTPTRP